MPDLAPTLCPRTGRHTWPEIIQYRITEGPQKNTILDWPPGYRIFPAPVATDPATGRTGRRVGSAAFELIIHDKDAYEELARTGALYRREHTGATGEMEDNRKTS